MSYGWPRPVHITKLVNILSDLDLIGNRNYIKISGIKFRKYCDLCSDNKRIFVSSIVDDVSQKIVYAIMIDQEVVYIGKAASGIKKRIYGYCNPRSTQTTNLKINSMLLDSIKKGMAASLYIMVEKAEAHFMGLTINISASIEEYLIERNQPKHNRTNNRNKYF